VGNRFSHRPLSTDNLPLRRSRQERRSFPRDLGLQLRLFSIMDHLIDSDYGVFLIGARACGKLLSAKWGVGVIHKGVKDGVKGLGHRA
jgi:hypothetical protein